MSDRARGGPTRIGPWRLLDLVQASLSMRGMGMIGGGRLPEYGPPDGGSPAGDPHNELPNSNISDGEQQQAMLREGSRRFVRTRRPVGE